MALGAAPADASRLYDPATTPRAKYVAPLAAWPAPSYRAKDFAVIHSGDWYHLFYTRVQRYVPFHYRQGNVEILNETAIGHAISRDLETWTELDTILTVRPAEWDAHHLWAPTVVQRNGVTWMLFTGVRDQQISGQPGAWTPREQKIGVAYSTDPMLRRWTRLNDPVWSPCAGNGLPGINWALCSPTIAGINPDFRDPHVLPPPPGSNEPWYLFFTARPKMDQYNYVVGVAQSTAGPAGPWSDLGALWDTYYPPLNSKIESPHVFRRTPDWHLFFTGDPGTTGIAWHTSHGRAIGPWTTQAPLTMVLKDKKDLPYDFPLEPDAWFASEVFSLDLPSGTRDYLAVVHAYDPPAQYNPPNVVVPEDISIIEFRQILWAPDGSFETASPNPVRRVAWTSGSVRDGDRVDLTLEVDAGAGRSTELEVFVLQGDLEYVIAPEAIGLPSVVTLVEPVTRIPWQARVPVPGNDLELVVRVVGQPKRLTSSIGLIPGQGGGSAGHDDVPIVRVRSHDPLAHAGDAAYAGGVTGDEASLVPGNPAAAGPSGSVAAGTVAASGTGDSPEGRRVSLHAVASAAAGSAPSFRLDLPAAAHARVDLYDVTGRSVRVLADGPYPRGTSTIPWDGRDGAGRVVPRGIYLARVVSGGQASSAKALFLP